MQLSIFVILIAVTSSASQGIMPMMRVDPWHMTNRVSAPITVEQRTARANQHRQRPPATHAPWKVIPFARHWPAAARADTMSHVPALD